MKQSRELTILSELSTIRVKNYTNEIELTFLPHLKEMLEVASAYSLPNTVATAGVSVASMIKESSATISVSPAKVQTKKTGRTLSLIEQPVEIVIEKPLDEIALANLLRLVGEHAPTSMSSEEAETLVGLLARHELIDQLKHKRAGIRIVFRIPEQTFRPLYHLPPIFEQFTGRDQELEQLQRRCTDIQVIAPKDEKSTSQIAGTGGVGKSQLANHFARLKFKEKYYTWVIWLVGGESEVVAQKNLLSQFSGLGLALGLEVNKLQEEVLHQLIYERLAAKGRGLVVVDDAPSYAAIKRYLPERFGQRQIEVLITTRNSLAWGPSITKIILDVLTLKDAKCYIFQVLKQKVSDTEAELLANTLDRYPLALTQALAYIDDNQCAIKEYCERYESIQAVRKVYLDAPVSDDDPYKLDNQGRKRNLEGTMWAVVQLSLEWVRFLCKTSDAYERAKIILMSTAYLAPEAAIAKEILGAWLPEDEGELQINSALSSLRALSLIEEGEAKGSYRVHQVVQDILRIEETAENTQNRLLTWHDILRAYLTLRAPGSMSQELKKYLLLKPHVTKLAQYLHLQANQGGDGFFLAEATMNRLLGIACKIRGEEKMAKLHYEKQLSCYREMRLKPDLAIGECQMDLGVSMLACGDPQGAKAVLAEALTILKKFHGEMHPDVGGCLTRLGQAMLGCGDPRGAKEQLNMALQILQSTLGAQHVDVAACLHVLGSTTLACGDPDGARKLLFEALAITQIHLGEEDGNVGRIMSEMGAAMRECGDSLGAKQQLLKALSILKTTLGNQHSEVGVCLMSLAAAVFSCDEVASALGLLKEALSILKNALGEHHSQVGVCLMNIGGSMRASGDLKGALLPLRQALHILKTTLGDQHASVGRCLSNLGAVMLSLGDLQAGEKLFAEALPILKKTLGDKHANVGECLLNLGATALKCDDPHRARQLLTEAIAILKVALGEQHLQVGRGLLNLGSATMHCFGAQNPKKIFKEALGILQMNLGENHEDVKACRSMLEAAIVCAWDTSDPVQAICRAASDGTLAELEELLQNFKQFANEVDQKTSQRRVPLCCAVIKKRPDHVRLLLGSVGFVLVKDAQSYTALDYALIANEVIMLEYFKAALIKHYAAYKVKENQLPKLLRICAQLGDESGLKLLIHLKVPVDEAGAETGQTALHRAVAKGYTACVRLLVEAGADPCFEDLKGQTSISLAENKPEILALLTAKNNVLSC